METILTVEIPGHRAVRLSMVVAGTDCMILGVADEGQNRPLGGKPITDFFCGIKDDDGHRERRVAQRLDPLGLTSSMVVERRVIRRLCALGLTPGTIVKVIREQDGGPILIQVRDSKLALGRGLAHKILVEEVAAKETPA